MRVLFDYAPNNEIKPRVIDGEELRDWESGPNGQQFIAEMWKRGFDDVKGVGRLEYLFQQHTW